MTLHHERTGDGRRLVLVHGFTQNIRCWAPFPEQFDDREIVLVDAPGHGASGHETADLSEGARLIGEAGGRGCYLGYSMGGRLVLHLALEHPALVERLILLGATAGIENDDERAERARTDAALAQRLESEGLEEFLADWLGLPMFAGIPHERNHLRERLENDPVKLAASLRNAGTGAQKPLWGRLAELSMPVLMLAGGHDEKFSEIAGRMAAAIGNNAAVAIIEGAGHAVHLEKPEATARTVKEWLAASDS